MVNKLGHIIPCDVDYKNMTIENIANYPDEEIRKILRNNYRVALIRYINPFIPRKMIISEDDLTIKEIVIKIHEYLEENNYKVLTMNDKVDIVLGKKSIEEFKSKTK